jgi:hypothetical protein
MTYQPPSDPEERLIEIALDPWVNYARWVLWFCGIVYLFLGVVTGPLYGISMMDDPSVPTSWAVGVAVVLGLVGLVVGGGYGLANLIVAGGLGRGSKWSWYATVLLGALQLPCCCLFGAILLFGMLKDKTRRLFLG